MMGTLADEEDADDMVEAEDTCGMEFAEVAEDASEALEPDAWLCYAGRRPCSFGGSEPRSVIYPGLTNSVGIIS